MQFAEIYNAGVDPLTDLTVVFNSTLPAQSVSLIGSLADSMSLAAGGTTQLSLTITAGLVRCGCMRAVHQHPSWRDVHACDLMATRSAMSLTVSCCLMSVSYQAERIAAERAPQKANAQVVLCLHVLPMTCLLLDPAGKRAGQCHDHHYERGGCICSALAASPRSATGGTAHGITSDPEGDRQCHVVVHVHTLPRFQEARTARALLGLAAHVQGRQALPIFVCGWLTHLGLCLTTSDA